MRLAAPLLVLALTLGAGCLAPEPGPETAKLLAYCPQWVQGPGQHTGTIVMDSASPNATTAVEPPSLTLDRRPLDVYRIKLDALQVEGGHVELRANALDNGTTGRNLYDYRQVAFRSVPYLHLGGSANDTEHEYDVLMAPLAATSPPAPTAVRLGWTFHPSPEGAGRASVSFTVTYHYRVCGAVV